MSTTASGVDTIALAELIERLGNVPIDRIRIRRPLGTATEAEYVEYVERAGRLCELVDGVIVEKATGYYESRLAAELIRVLGNFLVQHPLGFILAPDGMVRIEGQVRMPDVAFYPWSEFPTRRLPRTAILAATPALAVEVISPTNTEAEMDRKRRDCFLAGTQRFWQVYPDERRVRVFTDPVTFVDLDNTSTLEGAPILPGFTLAVRDWFDQAGERDPV
jgi:Uma2 family endonuclease